MERKSHFSNNVNTGLQRSNGFPRKLLDYQSRSSSIPRLPPIVQQDCRGTSCTTTSSRKPTAADRLQESFSLNCTSKQTKAKFLPKIEKSQFETTAVCYKVGNDSSRYVSREMRPRNELNPKILENDFKKDVIVKQETSLSTAIMGMRRKKKDRLSSYKCSNNTVIDDEISRYEQRMGFEVAISTTSVNCVKDMKGKMIHSGDVYNESVSSLINLVDNDEDEKSKIPAQIDSENDSKKIVPDQKCTAVRQRFLKALDAHFYNEFVNSNCGRRMAICDELENDMIGSDGKTSLTGLREHLRLQDVLDSWVL